MNFQDKIAERENPAYPSLVRAFADFLEFADAMDAAAERQRLSGITLTRAVEVQDAYVKRFTALRKRAGLAPGAFIIDDAYAVIAQRCLERRRRNKVYRARAERRVNEALKVLANNPDIAIVAT